MLFRLRVQRSSVGLFGLVLLFAFVRYFVDRRGERRDVVEKVFLG